MTEPTFVEFLNDSLRDKKDVNPRYSLRRFARALELEPSFLSKILRGKVPVTIETFDRIVAKLKLDGRTAKALRSQLFASRLKSQVEILSESTSQEEVECITKSQATVISDYEHYAVLECLKIESLKNSIAAIADRLQLPIERIQTALARLESVGLLRRTESGYEESSAHTSTLKIEQTNAALQSGQDQLLKLSRQAIWDVSEAERDHSAITIAVDGRQIPKAKAMIREFRRTLAMVLDGDSPEPDSVYVLQISLFPLTKTVPEEAH